MQDVLLCAISSSPLSQMTRTAPIRAFVFAHQLPSPLPAHTQTRPTAALHTFATAGDNSQASHITCRASLAFSKKLIASGIVDKLQPLLTKRNKDVQHGATAAWTLIATKVRCQRRNLLMHQHSAPSPISAHAHSAARLRGLRWHTRTVRRREPRVSGGHPQGHGPQGGAKQPRDDVDARSALWRHAVEAGPRRLQQPGYLQPRHHAEGAGNKPGRMRAASISDQITDASEEAESRCSQSGDANNISTALAALEPVLKDSTT